MRPIAGDVKGEAAALARFCLSEPEESLRRL